MPLQSIIAAALTDHSAHAKSLWIGGNDVLSRISIETIRLIEAGPGAVSTLSFSIPDETLTATVTEGQRVLFWDHTADVPLFLGFIQWWGEASTAIGRRVDVRCIGIESVLDWNAVLGPLDVFETLPADMVQAAIAQSATTGIPLMSSVAASDLETDFDHTILDIFGDGGAPLGEENLEGNGQTLRSVIDLIYALARNATTGTYVGNVSAVVTYVTAAMAITVDYYGNVRVWSPEYPPTHYATLTITNTIAGSVATTILRHDNDATGVPHAVYVEGANAAGTGVVADGTGLPGQVANVNDSNSNSAARLVSLGRSYLAQQAAVVRGTLRIEKYTNPSTPTSQVRAGGPLSITDARIGLSSYITSIASIEKTFNSGGTEDWTIAYGGLPPSAISQTRRLTRDTRS